MNSNKQKKINLKIHADDFGVSKGVTDNICSTFDDGILTSTSIIPNGSAFEYAINKYKDRKKLNLSIHINLVEGKPLTNPAELHFIVSKKGEFNKSFASLWLMYLLASPQKKGQIRQQVKKEIKAQINKVVSNCDNNFRISIDSHLHLHMVPFIFKILCELNDEFQFKYIRLPKEKLFFVKDKFIRNYFGLNIIKNILLKLLSANKKKILEKKGINSNDFFLGVLFTGRMSSTNVFLGLNKINKYKNAKLVEILFHPGGANNDESDIWNNQIELKSFYLSNWRKKERDLLKNEDFINQINSYKLFVN
tara:strand:- start:288 stop:1208 length:921 start_codon:yes stop_codon:yes gene_type:complete